MKTKILFLIGLLIGLNPMARSMNYGDITSIISDEVIDYCVEERARPNTGVNELSGNCGYNWSGIRTTRTEKTSTTIKIFWEHAKTLTYFSPEPTYVVMYTKKDENNWKSSKNLGGATSYTISGLEASTNYTIKLKRYCGGSIDYSDPVNLRTDSKGIDLPNPYVDCNKPTGLSITKVTPYSVEVKYENYNVSKLLKQERAFFRIHGGKMQDSHTHEAKPYYASPPWVLISPKSDKFTGLSPNTTYHWWVEKRCKGNLGGETVVMTESIDFTTPADIGSCGCINGNATIRDVFNGEYTEFYCGTITAKGVISEATSNFLFGSTGGSGSGNSGGAIGNVYTGSTKPPLGKTIFKASVVELNPGFETKITGTGSFVAVAFDPNTCQESAAAPPQGQVFGTAQKMSAPNNSLSNGRVLVPKKYKVYPNPNRGSFSIDFKEKDVVIKSITVYDMFGVRILHKRYNRRLDVEQYSLRLVKSGLYKIAIRTASGVAYETLLVEF